MLYPSSNRKEVSIANVSGLTCLGCRSLLAKERTTVLTYEIIVTSQSRAKFSTFSSSFFFLLHRQQQESSSLTKQERKTAGQFLYFPGAALLGHPIFLRSSKKIDPKLLSTLSTISPKMTKENPPQTLKKCL